MQQVVGLMAEKATDQQVKDLLQKSVGGINQHTQALRMLLTAQGGNQSASGEQCRGMQGLVEEAKRHALDSILEGGLRDLEIIAQYQRMSHYGIAGFGTAAAYANAAGLKDDATKLKGMTSEIYTADQYSSQLAERAEKEAAQS